MIYFVIAILIAGGLSVIHFLWAVFSWEMRWEMRLIRLAIHAALFGAAAAVLGLISMGWIKI